MQPSSPATTVDVLDYLIGDAKLWPRGGENYSNQIVDPVRQDVCWVKYANPKRFECWRWDESFVYHAIDHALDGDSAESYTFSDGRWLPRHLSINGWSLDLPNNRITWFDAQCMVSPAKSGILHYRQKAWIEPNVDAGGDLGVRGAIVLEYTPFDPASGRSATERYYFARGAGWYRWQRDPVDLQFNRVGGPYIPMDRSVWCGQ